MGANGAGNPVGFMGSLSDTLNIVYHKRGATASSYRWLSARLSYCSLALSHRYDPGVILKTSVMTIESLDPKSKEDTVKVTNLKNLPKFHIFEL